MNNAVKADGFWSPSPVGQIHNFIGRGVPKEGSFLDHRHAFIRNIAYNLQYLEYLNYTLIETQLHSTVQALTQKTFVMTGMSVIEALLWFVLKNSDQQKMNEWGEINKLDTQIFKENGCQYKITNVISKKLETPVEIEMSLDAMIKSVESKKLLGLKNQVYKDLNYLRKLRNRIHIHSVQHDQDTDWWSFGNNQVNLMKGVLGSVLRSDLFDSPPEKLVIFEYLIVEESIKKLASEL
jgi:hypothetical protein